MSRKFTTVDYEATLDQTVSLREALPASHLARFVVDLVAQLDLSLIYAGYADRGGIAYAPEILLALLFYGYATGVFSSRRIEKATYEMLPFRFIAGGLHPDHDTLANFRKTFLPLIKDLFVQMLLLAQAAGYLELGNISMDGSKVHANASKSKAVSYKRLVELEVQLRAEVDALFRLAEQADQPVPAGMVIADEIAIRQERLTRLAAAKTVLAARAQERYAAEKAEYDAKLRSRAEKTELTGRKPGGRAPAPPASGPQDTDQYNFTDPESRIMKNGNNAGFEQAYNAQAAVDQASRFIVACSLSNHANDKAEVEPTLAALAPELGTPPAAALDNGFFSAAEHRGLGAAARSSPTLPRGVNRIIRAGKHALPVNRNPRRPMPARKSRWPTSCTLRPAKPSIACASAPSNLFSASSKLCWAFDSSCYAASPQPVMSGA